MRLTLRIKGDLRAPMTARHAVGAFAEHTSGATIETASMVVNELVTNALLHACMEGEEIYLEVECERGRVWGHVRDPGDGFEVPKARLDEGALSGRGLILVDRLTSRWGVDNVPSTTVWFEIGERAGLASESDGAATG